MSQYRWMGRLFTFATVGALTSAGCFVVDDKKSDDDDGSSGEDSGGSSGTGGKATGGTGGKATGGTGGGDCAADYAACSVNGDCCGFPDTYCVGGGCAPLCTTNAECSTGCCYALEGGGMACAPASLCGGGTGGTSGTGGSPATGGAAGTGGGGSGAVMKFCNNLTKNAADVTLTVDFGGVRASTITGTCTPVAGSPCTTIATGSAIPATLYDGATVLFEGEFSLVEAGDEILVLAILDDVELVPALSGGPFPTGFVCSTTDYDDIFTAMLQSKSVGFSNKAQWAQWSKNFSSNRSLPALRQKLGSELSAFRSVR